MQSVTGASRPVSDVSYLVPLGTPTQGASFGSLTLHADTYEHASLRTHHMRIAP